MKERPILFNSEMVRAVLDDRKTQTRRVVKPQFNLSPVPLGPIDDPTGWWAEVAHSPIKCPYGKPGDRLYVRETWQILGESFSHPACEISYRADNKTAVKKVPTDSIDKYLEKIGEQYHPDEFMQMSHADETGTLNWRPSIHMPRWASRILLEVVSVRVERVQDIMEIDAQCEGVELGRSIGHGKLGCKSHREGFINLWDSINDARGFGWDKSPWVWVVEFKRVEG